MRIPEMVPKRTIYKETADDIVMDNFHQHGGFEIFQIWSENVSVLINDKIYKVIPGDVYFLNSHTIHWVKSAKNQEYVRSAITFSYDDIFSDEYELMNIFLQPDNNNSCLIRSDAEICDMYDKLFKKYWQENDNDDKYSKHLSHAILMNILVLINRHIESNFRDNIELSSSNGYIQQALNYINDNISCKISIDDIADYININKHYLCHLFKDATGTTLQNYISTRKLYIAKQQLIDLNYSVQYIAENLGYSGYSSFSQAFKRMFGVSPLKYKAMLKNLKP